LPVPAFSSALAWADLVMVITLRPLRLRRQWLTRLRIQAPAMHGLADIGIRQALAMPGARATGPGHRIRTHTGWVRVTTDIVITADTGGDNDYQADLSFQTSRWTTLALPPAA
jgi:hypothetical protein